MNDAQLYCKQFCIFLVRNGFTYKKYTKLKDLKGIVPIIFGRKKIKYYLIFWSENCRPYSGKCFLFNYPFKENDPRPIFTVFYKNPKEMQKLKRYILQLK